MTAVPFPEVADTFIGAVGTLAATNGITAFDGSLASEVPTPFVATTVNVYEVPFVRPVHTAVTPATAHEAPAGEDVTV